MTPRPILSLLVLAGAAAAFAPAPARRLSVACNEVKGPMSGGGFFGGVGGEPKDADEAQGLWEEKWAKDRQLREEREARVRARIAGQQAGGAGGAAPAAKAKRAGAERTKKAEAQQFKFPWQK